MRPALRYEQLQPRMIEALEGTMFSRHRLMVDLDQAACFCPPQLAGEDFHEFVPAVYLGSVLQQLC